MLIIRAEPKFIMRVVQHCRTPLSRQIGEAVRIRRRGGAGCILNSKAEYDRCRIPRLIVEEQDVEQLEKDEEQELAQKISSIEEQTADWGSRLYKKRELEDKAMRSKVTKIVERKASDKREQEEAPEGAERKKRRKLKYSLEQDNWGELSEQNTLEPEDTNHPLPWELPPKEQRPPSTRSRQSSMKRFLTTASVAPQGSPPELAGSETTTNELTDIRWNDICLEKPRKEDLVEKQDARELRREQVDNQKVVVDNIEPPDSPTRTFSTVSTTPSTARNPKPAAEKAVTVENPIRNCTFDGRGVCEIHQCIGTKIKLTSKKWKDRGGGKGFGWVSTKVTKTLCKAKNNTLVGPQISTDSVATDGKSLVNVNSDAGARGNNC